MRGRPPRSTLFPYPTLFRSDKDMRRQLNRPNRRRRHDAAIWGRQCRAGRIGAKWGRGLATLRHCRKQAILRPDPVLAEPRGRSHGESQAVKKMAMFRCRTAALAAGAWGVLAGQSLAAQANATTTIPSQLDLAHNTPS